jgi:hypothetical protein
MATVEVDGYEISYKEDNVLQRFRGWIVSPIGQTVERNFVSMAMEAAQNSRSLSGYAIIQLIRRPGIRITNDYGPILSRLAIAKHPELACVFKLKPVGWGKARKPRTARAIKKEILVREIE